MPNENNAFVYRLGSSKNYFSLELFKRETNIKTFIFKLALLKTQNKTLEKLKSKVVLYTLIMRLYKSRCFFAFNTYLQ